MSKTWRTRWAAIGAALAVTFGAGGLFAAQAGGVVSSYFSVEITRVLDTRIAVGLSGPLVSGTSQKLQLFGEIPFAEDNKPAGTRNILSAGVTSIVANVTAVNPSAAGFVSLRPGDATGAPSTSNININAPGGATPNAATVPVAADGTIDLYYFGVSPGSTTHLLIDVVGAFTEGGAGEKGDKGDPGETGPAGDSGPRGFSAWDQIPSGVTVTGAVEEYGHGAVWPKTRFVTIDLPGVAPSNLGFGQVNFASDGFAETSDDDDECVGTFGTPTAPPGKVCLYASVSVEFDNIASVEGTNGFGLLDRGFGVLFVLAAGGDYFFAFTWAYTAP